jgi:hypothetical protein
MTLIRALVFIFLLCSSAHAAVKAKNVFLITTDGLRWEEVFQGADKLMLSKEYGNISDTNKALAAYWRETPEARREILMPFLWKEIAARGQLWGNRTKKSDVRVSNGRNFSYPGYNEFLTGYADPKIDSNDKKLNANTNVFEWLHAQPDFNGRVAAVINWDVLPWILNGPRARFPIWSGFECPEGTHRMEKIPPALTEMVERSKTVWNGVLLDTFVGFAARDAVKMIKPRAMYISYGETDDWAHEGAYERYLKAAREFDRFIGELWQLVQSMPEYRDSTTFIIAVDHGRGPAPVAWKNHGANIPDSAYMWLAILGPDTPALGERSDTALITQSQIAATVAAAVGRDFKSASTAAPPIPGVISPGQ